MASHQIYTVTLFHEPVVVHGQPWKGLENEKFAQPLRILDGHIVKFERVGRVIQ